MEQAKGEALRRIVALLFALADLADCASLAPLPIRVLVLAILRPAEAVAQAFVFGVARDLGVTTPPQADFDGDAPDEAARIAYSLRILALVLANLAARAEYAASRGFIHMVTVEMIETLRKLGQTSANQNAPAPDTS